ncbi:family 2 glycosyl transferase [Algibacter marinivivus]|uniref:Family 2 glycosyl transferase n=1 Tax=Algibacter marinivivus TaxID=2100723 RepID=A0A2U2X2I0_9FLAO|nr:family 2 glycosyl transferase [Algibacter marinivivus]PWH81998.1 family 2 glycosyl transferase [Algibacter marinivivus]
MKIGVIIIFHNNENDIDTEFFIEYLNQANNLELCLVNNASRDNTFQLLKEIKADCSTTVSLVDIKKFKSDISAVRSGARFMFNQFDLNHIGYINTNEISNKPYTLSGLIKAMSKNQNIILEYNISVIEKKEIKQTLFQSVFSIIEYLEKLKINNQLVNYKLN